MVIFMGDLLVSGRVIPKKFFSRLAIGQVRNRGSILRAPPILDTTRHLPRPHGPTRESPVAPWRES